MKNSRSGQEMISISIYRQVFTRTHSKPFSHWWPSQHCQNFCLKSNGLQSDLIMSLIATILLYMLLNKLISSSSRLIDSLDHFHSKHFRFHLIRFKSHHGSKLLLAINSSLVQKYFQSILRHFALISSFSAIKFNEKLNAFIHFKIFL